MKNLGFARTIFDRKIRRTYRCSATPLSPSKVTEIRSTQFLPAQHHHYYWYTSVRLPKPHTSSGLDKSIAFIYWFSTAQDYATVLCERYYP